MEELKYYIPEISEFHIGFEYESIIPGLIYGTQIYDGRSLNDYEGEGQGSIQEDIEDGEIRVKYLDKEDIESLPGVLFWKDRGLAENNSILFSLKDPAYEQGSVVFKYWFGNNRLQISRPIGTVFNGFIKNKSELKKLLKQLGINE